jgi:hypothetical protein
MGRFSCPCGLQYSMDKQVVHPTILKRQLQYKTMAKITFSLVELTQILVSNELLHGEILRLKVDGERIHFVIRTNSFVLPYIPASLGFLSFSDNQAVLELTIVSSHLNKAVSRIKQMLQLKLPAYMKLEYPKIFVDVEKLLEEKNIKGIRVENVSLKDGEFTITTCNI